MGAVTREVLGGVAFPAEEGPCYISGIGFFQVNHLTRVEPNTGLSSLRGCKVGLGGEGLTNVVVEREKSDEALPSCLTVRGDTLDLGVTRFFAEDLERASERSLGHRPGYQISAVVV